MSKEFRRLLTVIILILLLRIGLVNIYQLFENSGGYEVLEALRLIIFDPLNLPIDLAVTLLLVYSSTKVRWVEDKLGLRLVVWALIILLSSFMVSIIASFRLPCEAFSPEWYSLFFTAILFNIVVVLIYYVWEWYRSSHTLVSKALAKSERSQYQYAQLKRQLNPHFLFNSLSILDYLVQEKETERASNYIKKLANIYRYLLKQEEYPTIELQKEVDFVGLYIDIMRERFLDGFEVDINLSDESFGHHVVPCALQVLVENAFKHNAVGPNNKLRIEIYDQDGRIVVKNNINLKNHPSESNGCGLKNLRERYKLVARQEIEVCDDKNYFIVKLPLL